MAVKFNKQKKQNTGSCIGCGGYKTKSPHERVDSKDDTVKPTDGDTQIVNENLRRMLKDAQTNEEMLTVERDKLDDKHNKLKQKYAQQRILNFDDYNKWDCEDVMTWIFSLDNERYRKYEKKLSACIRQENISGKYLKE
eukprot:314369_1